MGVANVDIMVEASECPRCAKDQDSADKEKTDTNPPKSSSQASKKPARKETGNSGKGRAGKGEELHPHPIQDRDVFRFINLPKEPVPYVIRPADEALEVQLKERVGKQKKAILTKKKEQKQKRIQGPALIPDPVPHRVGSS